jgi:hypothetical protein
MRGQRREAQSYDVARQGPYFSQTTTLASHNKHTIMQRGSRPKVRPAGAGAIAQQRTHHGDGGPGRDEIRTLCFADHFRRCRCGPHAGNPSPPPPSPLPAHPPLALCPFMKWVLDVV